MGQNKQKLIMFFCKGKVLIKNDKYHIYGTYYEIILQSIVDITTLHLIIIYVCSILHNLFVCLGALFIPSSPPQILSSINVVVSLHGDKKVT